MSFRLEMKTMDISVDPLSTPGGCALKRRIRTLALALLLAAVGFQDAGAHSGSAQTSSQSPGPEFPETPAGKTAAAYFKAHNAGEEAMKGFFEKFSAESFLQRMPIQTRLDRYRQMSGQLGSLTPQKIVESRPSFIAVTAQGQRGQVLRLDFELEDAEPFGLLGIRILPLGGQGDEGPQPDPKKDDAELFAAVNDYARKAVEAGDFSGVILIARTGLPVFEEAFGYADREKKIPNRIDTKFNIGSINKSFTGLAIRRLAAEKKLSLDDTIGKFLPDYPNKDAAARATVRHLLEMSSGIGDFFGDLYDAADKEKILTLADYLPLFADRPLEFEPGKGNRYSNGGYIVLGLIIEKATGRDYYSYIRDTIFKPAGMGDSGWIPKAAEVPNRALGYVRDGSSWKTNYDTLPGKGSSAGGGYSTAGDLLKYTIALEKGLYGQAGEELRGGVGIAGGAPGLNAALEWMPERGLTIVVMANLSPPAAMRMARQIRAWLPR
jgi:D-alanyl-D-alanine carboxypeptidase